MKLTARQGVILRFIEDFSRERGLAPTLREIQDHFGFASSFAANRHVMALEKKGLLERGGGRARAMILKNPVMAGMLKIPVFGVIPAGLPSDQEEQSGRFIEISPAALGLSGRADVFALEVRGDSMIDAHIVDGDLAIMERKPAAPRDIVAALIDGEVTLKRLVMEKGRQFLKAENEHYADLIPVLELIIQGVLRAVIRTNVIV